MTMMLMPAATDKCPICATAHAPDQPHNAQSMYYLYRFFGIRGRWPTWADAVAHCSPEVRAAWKQHINERFPGNWTEPENGEPIADPPAESVHQAIGDISTRGFGPEYDPSL